MYLEKAISFAKFLDICYCAKLTAIASWDFLVADKLRDWLARIKGQFEDTI